MQKDYYHCFYCNNIPSIIIDDDKIKVSCPEKNHEITLDIENFCEKCIKNCCCENGLYVNHGKISFCKICLSKMEQYSEIYQKSITCIYTTSNVKKYNQSLNKF